MYVLVLKSNTYAGVPPSWWLLRGSNELPLTFRTRRSAQKWAREWEADTTYRLGHNECGRPAVIVARAGSRVHLRAMGPGEREEYTR
jgi:hypothetical protein